MNPWILGGSCFVAGVVGTLGAGYVYGKSQGWFAASKPVVK